MQQDSAIRFSREDVLFCLAGPAASCTISGSDTNSWARVCDMCRAAPCTVYCRANSAFLCTSYDARIHAANQVASRHERVWVCELCERVPAAFLCKADAASLRATCDAKIHSDNPLACRHQRVPTADCVYGPQGGRISEDRFPTLPEGDDHTTDHEGDEDAPWLLLNPVKNSNNQNRNGFFTRGGEVDEYLDLLECNSGVDNQFCEQYNQQ